MSELNPIDAFKELARVSGGCWDGVDADEFVRQMRHGDEDRIATLEAELKKALSEEPGTFGAVVRGLFDEAEKRGIHPPYSSRPPLLSVFEHIDKLEAEIKKHTDQALRCEVLDKEVERLEGEVAEIKAAWKWDNQNAVCVADVWRDIDALLAAYRNERASDETGD